MSCAKKLLEEITDDKVPQAEVLVVPEKVCLCAASMGQLGVLQWMHQEARYDLCLLHTSKNCGICQKAVQGGHLELLQWVHTNGCPWDERTCSMAVCDGHLEVLKWARANGFPWNKSRQPVVAT